MLYALTLTIGMQVVALPRGTVPVGVHGSTLMVTIPTDTEIAAHTYACLLVGASVPETGAPIGVAVVEGQMCAVYDLGEEAS